MKKTTLKNIAVAAIAILIIFGAASCKKESIDLTGTQWTMKSNWNTGASSANIRLTFNSDKTISYPNLIAGSTWNQTGNNMILTFPSLVSGGSSTVATYSGTINKNSMSGSTSNTLGDNGTFSGSKQ